MLEKKTADSVTRYRKKHKKRKNSWYYIPINKIN